MNKTLNNQIGWLRLIALIEGISFLLILFVSMPLKYIWNIPEPNIYIGYSHGILFMLYLITVLFMSRILKWSNKVTFMALLVSVIPFGTFWADKTIFRAKSTLPKN